MSNIDRTALDVWAKQLQNASNPLKLTEELKDEIVKEYPAQEVEGAVYLGTYLIPRSYVQYEKGKQSRDKSVIQLNKQNISFGFKTYGILRDKERPMVSWNPQDGFATVEGIVGYHRDDVFDDLNQDFYMYDVYDFSKSKTPAYDKEVKKSISNHHKDAFMTQTKHDYIKVVVNAVGRNIISKDKIPNFVDDICDKSKKVKETIVKEASAGLGIYADFRTYSSSKEKDRPNTLNTFLAEQDIVKQGIADREPEEINSQGYISYVAYEGDGVTSWARGIMNGIKYGVPVYIFGYAPNRVSDLLKFRKEWIEEFQVSKNYFLNFAETIIKDSSQLEINEDSFPVKIGGFYPHYIKPDGVKKGRETEYGIVDMHGNTIEFKKTNKCLTQNLKFDDEGKVII
tara:strand:+ start:420 stop:1613 length:1194 start_codon:yes stop_codon:yes gene_type:complete